MSINIFYKLMQSFLLAITNNAQSTQNNNLHYCCNISRKKKGMRLIFCMQVNIKISYKLFQWILGDPASHAQSMQHSASAKSLQYIRKEVRDEVDFLCRETSNFCANWYCHVWSWFLIWILLVGETFWAKWSKNCIKITKFGGQNSGGYGGDKPIFGVVGG